MPLDWSYSRGLTKRDHVKNRGNLYNSRMLGLAIIQAKSNLEEAKNATRMITFGEGKVKVYDITFRVDGWRVYLLVDKEENSFTSNLVVEVQPRGFFGRFSRHPWRMRTHAETLGEARGRELHHQLSPFVEWQYQPNASYETEPKL